MERQTSRFQLVYIADRPELTKVASKLVFRDFLPIDRSISQPRGKIEVKWYSQGFQIWFQALIKKS